MEINSNTTQQISSHEGAIKHLLDGMHVKFPTFKHEHHEAVVNVNAVDDERRSVGDRVADAVASTVGSWPFIITQSIILALWIILNSIAWIYHWDPYPFILLNLALSFQAAYAAPFVMMSQNRQAAKDRLMAENDYKTNVKGEQEVCHVMDHLDHQDALILEIVKRLDEQNKRIDQQQQVILQLVQQMESQHEGFQAQHQEMLEWFRRNGGQGSRCAGC